MTSLQGHIDITYSELVARLGPPPSQGDNFKTNAEWFVDRGGRRLYIYNWKNGPTYGGKPVEEITRWNIGGQNYSDVTFIRDLLCLNVQTRAI